MYNGLLKENRKSNNKCSSWIQKGEKRVFYPILNNILADTQMISQMRVFVSQDCVLYHIEKQILISCIWSKLQSFENVQVFNTQRSSLSLIWITTMITLPSPLALKLLCNDTVFFISQSPKYIFIEISILKYTCLFGTETQSQQHRLYAAVVCGRRALYYSC